MVNCQGLVTEEEGAGGGSNKQNSVNCDLRQTLRVGCQTATEAQKNAASSKPLPSRERAGGADTPILVSSRCLLLGEPSPGAYSREEGYRADLEGDIRHTQYGCYGVTELNLSLLHLSSASYLRTSLVSAAFS